LAGKDFGFTGEQAFLLFLSRVFAPAPGWVADERVANLHFTTKLAAGFAYL
jgi:hypothetical protein